MALVVCETFASLMGESTRAGLPAFFIRLTGCNLRCRYCDTTYAYEGGRQMTVAALMEMALVQPQRLVLVTGGEPLLQTETPALLAKMLEAGFTVCLETNGSQPIAAVAAGVHRILDLKCPGSGMSQHNDWRNLELLTPGDEVKFVVADRHDFNWALEVVDKHGLTKQVPVLISPVFGQVSLREAATWILDSRRPLRLNPQLHKYVWGPEARGV
ncbi:MAG TPA: radical SAM protein [Desulfobaccales bacterium]|nr:radical SAM protein [Desulfobaccales bacterium]